MLGCDLNNIKKDFYTSSSPQDINLKLKVLSNLSLNKFSLNKSSFFWNVKLFKASSRLRWLIIAERKCFHGRAATPELELLSCTAWAWEDYGVWAGLGKSEYRYMDPAWCALLWSLERSSQIFVMLAIVSHNGDNNLPPLQIVVTVTAQERSRIVSPNLKINP